MKIASIAVLSGLLLLVGCATKLTVRKATPQLNETSGIYYALPRTVVLADVTVASESFKPGKYADTTFARTVYPEDELPIEGKPEVFYRFRLADLARRARQGARLFCRDPRRPRMAAVSNALVRDYR